MKTITLTNSQWKTVKHALYLAEKWEEAGVDATMVELVAIKGKGICRTTPKELKKDARQGEKNMAAFKKLRGLLTQIKKEE